MKRTISLLLALGCLVGLLSGCRDAGPVATDPATQPSRGETTEPGHMSETTLPLDSGTTLPGGESPVGMGQTGKLRVTYTGIRSGVRYITDPSQLPEHPELEQYDEAYFQSRALLLVTETVNTGSIQVGIESILVENGVATVKLKHDVPSGMHTADMTTWLLWVEVDAGLDYTWVLANPALEPQKEQNELY